MEELEMIIGVFYWMYNIPHGFVEEAFRDHPHKEHFMSKFAMYCKREGGYASANAILAFAGELSEGNMKIFAEAIFKYIKNRKDG